MTYRSVAKRCDFFLMRGLQLLIVGCLLIGLQKLSLAQNRATGEIRGTVTDQSGARIPGVTVQLLDTLTGVTVKAVSNTTGTYDAPFLQPGTYTLTFQKSGFEKFVRSGLILHLSVMTVDAKLHVGAVSQSVTVSGASPLVETESSSLKTTLASNEILQLPSVSNNIYSYWALVPGANYGDARAIGQAAGGAGNNRVGFNGQRPFEINAITDGGTATYPQSYNIDQNALPLDAVSEFDFETNTFSAEYGNGLAVFSTLTKSGTNQFHGDVFEFDQNDAFGTRNFFAQSIPTLIWNQFGGSIGGPIRHDKLFFFFSFQGLRDEAPSPELTTVPTSAEQAGDFSASGIPQVYDPATTAVVNGAIARQPFVGNIIPSGREDPVAAKIFSFWPSPNLPGISNNYYMLGGSSVTNNQYVGKVDYDMSSANRISGMFFDTDVYNYDRGSFPSGVCGSGGCDNELIQLEPEFVLSDSWSINPQMVNEFRFAFLRSNVPWAEPSFDPSQLGLKNPGSDVFPDINVQGTVTPSLCGSCNGNFDLRENSFVPSDTLTWIKGEHTLEFGGEFAKLQVNNAQPWVDEGNFTFSGLATYDPAISTSTGVGLADLYLGEVSDYGLDIAPDVGERSWWLESFVQDNYKIRPNLTLNVGVRYQVQPGWSEAFNRLSNFDPTLINPLTNTPGAIWFAGQNGRTALEGTKWDLFAPRIGFAWSTTHKLVVRGGYGVFLVPWSCDTFCNGSPAGYSTLNSVISTDNITPVFTLAQGPPPYAQPSAALRTPSLLNGQSISYTPYGLPEGYTQQLQFSIQRQLGSNVMVQAAYIHTKGTHLEFPVDIDQVPENLLGPGNAQLRRPYPQYDGIGGTNSFDGESVYDALQLSAEKRASHGLTLMANYTVSKTLDNCSFDHTSGAGCTWQNAYDPAASYGLSQLDVPQSLASEAIYQLGTFRHSTADWKALNDVVGGWQVSGVFTAESGIPFTPTTAGTNLSNSLAGTWLPNRIGNGTVSNPTINEWFNPAAFAAAAPYTYGNGGRDILFGPGFWDFDFALAKNFRLGERANLQVRVDTYDLLNHPNFGLPNSSVGSASAGVITSATTNRLVQLGARLNF
jgi:hypothetical protein